MLNLNSTLGIHQRIAELWVVSKIRTLNDEEQEEWELCNNANVNNCWKEAYEYNMAIMDLMISDVNYEDEISLE